MGNGPAGQAILGPTDGVMIADADWPASHSHPRVSVRTVTSKTRPKPANYYQCLLTGALSQCLKIHTRMNLQYTIGDLPAVSGPSLLFLLTLRSD